MIYGKELIIDLHRCIRTAPEEIFFIDLCELIDMEREDLHFWGPYVSEDPKIAGLSAVQFIITSSIVVHGLSRQRSVYINLFSCKEFDARKARNFISNWFGATTCKFQIIERTMPCD